MKGINLSNLVRKKLLYVGLLIFLSWLLNSCFATPTVSTNPTVDSIRVVMDNNYPPYAFVDDKGELQGILIDQWHLWEEHTGIKVIIVGLPWGEALERMKAGEFDVIDTIFYTEERAKVFDYTQPYAKINVCIFFRNSISGLANAQSLKGFRVAVKSGDANVDYLLKQGISSLVYYNSYEEIVRAAARNEENIFVIDESPGLYFLYRNNIGDEFNHSEPLYSGEFHRAVRKGNTAILELVKQGFASISTREYREIENRWYGTRQANEIAVVMPYLGAGLVLTLSIIIFLVFFNSTLQKQIHKHTKELRESEALFRDSIEFLPIPIGITDNNGNLIEVNRKFTELYGYVLEDIRTIEKWMYRAYPEPEYRKKVIAQWNTDATNATENETNTPLREYKVTGKDGNLHDVEIIMRPVGDLWVTSFVEITERKLVEEQLRASDERHRTLFEDSPVPLFEEDFSVFKAYVDELKKSGITDFKNYFKKHPEDAVQYASMIKIIDVNKAVLSWYGNTNKENFLVSLDQMINPMEYENFTDELIALIEGGGHYEITTSRFTRSGAPIHLIINGTIAPGYEETWGRVLISILDITDRKLAEENLAQQVDRLRALRSIDQAIITSMDLDSILRLLAEETAKQLNVDAVAILLFDSQAQQLNFATGLGFHTNILRFTHLNANEGLAGKVIQERKLVSVPNMSDVAVGPAYYQNLISKGYKSYFGFPLIANNQLYGVMEIFQISSFDPSEDWLSFLSTLAGQAAISIANATLLKDLQVSNIELEQAYDTTLDGWAHALDLRDKETVGHTRRVAEMAVTLARSLGYDEEEIIQIRRGGLLHDIGKMGIPDSILLKPDVLTEDELTIMQRHPIYAYEMLSKTKYLQPALEIPYCHHERWDGSGYPRGLKGDEIPLAARIFAVVDVWDALRSDRPYRRAWSKKKVLNYMQQESGKHFDPQIVSVFLSLVEDRKL